MIYYAHSCETEPSQQRWQELKVHLRNVAELAGSFAKEATAIGTTDSLGTRQWREAFCKTTWLAGLLHDLGKYRLEFQQYLRKERGSSRETVHSVYGAAAMGYHFEDLLSAFAIAGHHSGLHDCSDLSQLLQGSKFKAAGRFAELLDVAEKELGSLPEFQPLPIGETEIAKRHYEFVTRMLFSIVVDADRLDSERWEKEQKLGMPWQRAAIRLDAAELLRKLLKARDDEAQHHPKDDLNALRNGVFDACLHKGESSPQGFFSLTVPTGGGKTLSSMAFALAHAKRHGLRRVIVVLPYLSIIEQNARKYRDIFGQEYVLEHHSAVEIGKPSHPSDADEPAEASDMEKAMENWDAPIIVTTSVQFLETLFAASPGWARKLHNVARSVVIFDEVQTLPTHLLEPTLDVLRELKDHWGLSFLFCSATQPAFRRSANLKSGFGAGEVTEIISDPTSLYIKLRRVDYHIETKDDPWDWGKLAERMLSQPQALCVLNLRRHAFEVWQAMRGLLKEKGRERDLDGLFHLSSAMCPAHRLDLLGLSKDPLPDNIKARLKNGQPCWVVSTQLVEAGVDIDFPVVFRALGPLDSIVQAAGRCNREGTLRDAKGNLCRGKMIVFRPVDAGLPPGIYSRATAITPSYLDADRLSQDPDMFASYFNELYQISPTDCAKKGQHTIQYDRAEFNFRRVAENAKVIKDDTVAVIVPYGAAIKLVSEIREDNGKEDYRDMLRRLQRYMVNVRTRAGPASDFEKLQRFGAVQPLVPGRLEIPVLGEQWYKTDPPLGVVIENRPLEDYIL